MPRLPFRRRDLALASLLVIFCTGAGGGVDPSVFGLVALALLAAKIFGDLFARLRQPSVMGELVAGVVLGNLTLVGLDWTAGIATDPNLELLAEVGVIVLLFQVGLESNLTELARTGLVSLSVAIVGVVVPVALGYLVHASLVSDATWHTHLFVGAVLAATSVGITARVLQEMGKISSPTGIVILGAAVLDDVLGLILLAVVTGIVAAASAGGASVDILAVLLIAGKAVGFLGGAVLLGRPASRWLFKVAEHLSVRGVLVATALAFGLLVAYGAGAVGLHPIVGAFAAGLVLDEVFYRDLETKEQVGLEHAVEDIAAFLVPIFFVVTGAKVDLGVLTESSILVLAALLSVGAIIGKQACALVAWGPGVNRMAVGIGMIPRGEVGLIFANVGAATLLAGVPVINKPTYAAVVIMVMITTMATPPVLAWALRRDERNPVAADLAEEE